MPPRPTHPRAARRQSSTHAALRARAALTLIEIAFSLVILVFGVVSVMLLFPAGLKAQQLARFQLYACAKAQEMIDSFNSSHNANPAIDTEAFAPWEVPVGRRTQAWDLEERLSSNSFGMLPLPLDIAKRLDSDGDEIQRLLADGGYIYYSQPLATTNLQESSLQITPANEAQRLVCAVSGYAQNNALHIFPWKNWPYVTPYPSPPIHGLHYPDFLQPKVASGATPTTFRFTDPTSSTSPDYTRIDGRRASYCWEETIDPDIQKVFSWNERGIWYGYLPYSCGQRAANGSAIDPASPDQSPVSDTPTPVTPSWDGAVRYFEAAVWYCKQKGLRPEFYNPPPEVLATYNPATSAVAVSPDYPFESGTAPQDRWAQVQAMRYLAHAATCLTRWYGSAQLGADRAPYDICTGVSIPTSSSPANSDPRQVKLTYAYTVGINIPNFTLDGQQGPWAFDGTQTADPTAAQPPPVVPDHTTPVTGNQFSRLTHHHILYYHERCLRLIMAFAAANPYDWGAPRPLQRSIMTDYPLIESDLFSAPLSGQLYNTPGITCAQWQPIPAQRITHFGRGFMFPGYAAPGAPYDANLPIPENSHYDVGGAYLAARIDPFWGDPAHFTLTAPFQPLERCRELVFWMVDWQSYEDFETASSAPVDASRYPFAAPLLGASMAQRMSYADNGHEGGHDFGTGHPIGTEFRDEQLYAFRNPEKVLLFKEDVTGLETGSDVSGRMVINENGPDQGTGTQQMQIFSGRFGADRNFNKRLDRGPIPRSVRLRAIPVGRFLFYDPRVPAMIH
ncbi:MAG: hypothetical protein H0X38_02915 [Planctomycetes bacterium]|nr:hypothetical protein [Planctomycetota bacterium]